MRAHYTTARVRAEDLTLGDVAMINGTWSFVYECYGEMDLDAAESECGADPEMLQKIREILGAGGSDAAGTYVAVRYLYTHITSYPGPAFRNSPNIPLIAIAAYSSYELVEIQTTEGA